MEKKINLTVDKTENELRVDIFIKKSFEILMYALLEVINLSKIYNIVVRLLGVEPRTS